MATNIGPGLIHIEAPTLETIRAILGKLPVTLAESFPNILNIALQVGRRTLLGIESADKGIPSKYNAPITEMLQAVQTVRSGTVGDQGEPSARFIVKGPRIPLYMFPNIDIKPEGVMVSEVRDRAPFVLRHAFTTPGQQDILQREGASSYPIEPIVGLSIAHMARNPEIVKEVDENTQKEFNNQLWNWINKYWRRV